MACLLLAGEAAWRWIRRAPPSSFSARLDQVLLIAFLVASAGGLGVLVGGGQPGQSLHFVYAVVAIGVTPIASFLTRGRAPRIQAGATVVAAVVALIVIARLFQTG